ncbi:MAG: hypothetical protein RJA81_1042, partial [Planctomycetota bacterium]
SHKAANDWDMTEVVTGKSCESEYEVITGEKLIIQQSR